MNKVILSKLWHTKYKSNDLNTHQLMIIPWSLVYSLIIKAKNEPLIFSKQNSTIVGKYLFGTLPRQQLKMMTSSRTSTAVQSQKLPFPRAVSQHKYIPLHQTRSIFLSQKIGYEKISLIPLLSLGWGMGSWGYKFTVYSIHCSAYANTAPPVCECSHSQTRNRYSESFCLIMPS